MKFAPLALVLGTLIGTSANTIAQAPTVAAVGAKAAGSILTGAMIDDLFSKLQGLLADAVQKGDYLLARAAVEARSALEAYKNANLKLMDRAFDSLDKASRDNFGRLSRTINDLNEKTLTALEGAKQIAENAVQITSLIDLQGNRTYVLRHEPTVFLPGGKSPLVVRVRGVSLDNSNPRLQLGILTIPPDSISQNELIFSVPTEFFRHLEDKLAMLRMDLQYETVKAGNLNRIMGKREVVTRPLSVILMPWTVADYRLRFSTEELVRETRRISSQLDQFKGRNQDQSRVIRPPEGDWRIDLNSLTHTQGEGEGNSYCIGFSPEGRSESGVTFRAHVGEIKNARYPRGADGYVSCSVAYTVVKDSTTQMQQIPMRGRISWREAKLIQVPPNMKTFVLEVQMFDGTKEYFLNDDQRKFVSVQKQPENLVVRAVVPAGIPN